MINLISIISMFGVGVGTMALVIVMSAFNGLEDLVESLYSRFDAEIRIEPATGKTFAENSLDISAIQAHPDVRYVNRSLEETALLKYGESQVFATIKGVEPSFIAMSGMDSLLWTGTTTLEDKDGNPFVLLGYFIAKNLGVNLGNMFRPMQVYAANKDANLALSLESAFVNKPVYASGIFAINAEFDTKYIVAPISFVRELLRTDDQVTALEVALEEGTDDDAFKAYLQQQVGPEFTVKTRYELNELLYKTNNTEKWVTFLILTFILVIATFNIIGSLTMLIIDKKRDIFILNSAGANRKLLERVFFLEGLLISAVGGGVGMVLGLLLCVLQDQFSLIKLEGLLVDTYPIQIEWLDIIAITGVVAAIGMFSAFLPARYMVRKYV